MSWPEAVCYSIIAICVALVLITFMSNGGLD